MTTSTADAFVPRVRWSWLWARKVDVLWNLVPFWLGFGLIAALFATRGLGTSPDDAMNLTIAGRTIPVMAILLYGYGPLVDAPHLWATIARTYTDRDEWASRRRLFLASLAILLIGPAIILLPYALRAIGALPEGAETLGWRFWTMALGFYALFHINRQHWGFVSLYKRKNGDNNPAENRLDSRFFQAAIWLPYLAMLAAPWHQNPEGARVSIMSTAIGGTTLAMVLHVACHVAFWALCVGYTVFQVKQWRAGSTRNGPKLVYTATILALYYLTFALHPRIAMFWVLITGTGHCAQYHAVVWAYGKKKYAPVENKPSTLPTKIFGNMPLYITLGVIFGLVTMQGPGAGMFKDLVARTLQSGLFSRAFAFLDQKAGLDLGIKIAAAFVAGVRIHHFYVDSKIWKVGKSAALAKNLDVSPNAAASPTAV